MDYTKEIIKSVKKKDFHTMLSLWEKLNPRESRNTLKALLKLEWDEQVDYWDQIRAGLSKEDHKRFLFLNSDERLSRYIFEKRRKYGSKSLTKGDWADL